MGRTGSGARDGSSRETRPALPAHGLLAPTRKKEMAALVNDQAPLGIRVFQCKLFLLLADYLQRQNIC